MNRGRGGNHKKRWGSKGQRQQNRPQENFDGQQWSNDYHPYGGEPGMYDVPHPDGGGHDDWENNERDRWGNDEPARWGNHEPANWGNLEPANWGNHEPANWGNHEPANWRNLEPANWGNHGSWGQESYPPNRWRPLNQGTPQNGKNLNKKKKKSKGFFSRRKRAISHRVAAHGLDSATSKEDMWKELEGMGHKVMHLYRRRQEGKWFFIIDLEIAESNQEVFNLTMLANQPVTIKIPKPPHRKAKKL